MKVNLTQEEQDVILADDSQTLATRIVIHRMLNSFKEEAKLSMYELMRRRIEDKENFEFEKFIELGVKENEINLRIPSFTDMKRSMMEKTIYSMMRSSISSDDSEEETDDEVEKPTPEPLPIDEKKQKDLNTILETLATILEDS